MLKLSYNKIKKNSDIIIFAFSIKYKGITIFSDESENNIYVNSKFKLNEK